MKTLIIRYVHKSVHKSKCWKCYSCFHYEDVTFYILDRVTTLDIVQLWFLNLCCALLPCNANFWNLLSPTTISLVLMYLWRIFWCHNYLCFIASKRITSDMKDLFLKCYRKRCFGKKYTCLCIPMHAIESCDAGWHVIAYHSVAELSTS